MKIKLLTLIAAAAALASSASAARIYSVAIESTFTLSQTYDISAAIPFPIGASDDAALKVTVFSDLEFGDHFVFDADSIQRITISVPSIFGITFDAPADVQTTGSGVFRYLAIGLSDVAGIDATYILRFGQAIPTLTFTTSDQRIAAAFNLDEVKSRAFRYARVPDSGATAAMASLGLISLLAVSIRRRR